MESSGSGVTSSDAHATQPFPVDAQQSFEAQLERVGLEVVTFENGHVTLGLNALPDLAPGGLYIGDVWVNEDARGRGEARRMLEAVMARAKAQGVQYMLLTVPPGQESETLINTMKRHGAALLMGNTESLIFSKEL